MIIRMIINTLIVIGICVLAAAIITPIIIMIYDDYKERQYKEIQKALHEEYLEELRANKKKSKDDLYIIINKTEDKT